MAVPITKDDAGNMIVTREGLPPMTIRPGTVSPDTWSALEAQMSASTTLPPAARYTGPTDVGPVTQSLPPIYEERPGTIWGGAARQQVAPSMSYVGEPMSAPGMNEPPAPTQINTGSPTLTTAQENAPGTTTAPPQSQQPAQAANPFAMLGTSPRLAAMQEKAIGDQRKANADMAGLEEQRALEESQAQRKANAALEKIAADSQAQRDYLMNRYELEQRARNQAVEDYSKMKVDPTRLLSKQSDSEKVMWTIGAVLGGIGAALTHGPNMAVEALNRAVDQDIDSQKTAIMNAKDNVSMRNNLVAQMREKIGDFDQSVLAAKQVRLEQLKRQVDTLASEYRGPEAQARAKMLNAGLDERLAELKLQQDAQAKARFVQLLDKMPAPGGKALNEGTAKELGEANSATKSAQDLLDKFNGSAEGVGGWLMSFLPRTDASKYEDRARVATQVIGSYLEGGKLSDANVPQYRAMLPKPGESKEVARNKVDAIVKLVAARQSAQKAALAGSGYNVSGIKDAAPAIKFTPMGR